MSSEHLVAVMLETGRLKDYLRIAVFLQHKVVNLEELESSLAKYSLTEKWEQNINKFRL